MSRRLDVLLVVGGLVAGTALRVSILLSSQGALDSDEAVWGLMARHVLDGQLPTFFWGQSYGGTQSTFVTAALFWVFGAGVTVLRTVPIFLWSVGTVLLWRVARRTLGEPRARLAATLFWMWPIYFVWKSTRAHGFYGSGLVFGLWALLAALRLRERTTRLDLASFGLALGLCWWATPEAAILGLPAVLWLLWSRPAVLRGAPIVVVTFVIASAPWWIFNVRHDWASLSADAPDQESKLGHLHNLVASTLPTALGVRLPFSLAWFPDVELGVIAYAVVLAGFAFLLVRRPVGLGLPLLAAVVFAVLYTISPYTWLDTEPRYLTLFSPVIVLFVAYAARTPRRALALFAVAAALSFGGLAVMDSRDLAASRAEGVAVPASFGSLLRTLRARGVDRVWATYWIAYRITFESGERIIAAVPGSSSYSLRDGRVVPGAAASASLDGRYAPYQRDVARSRDAAHVFAAGEPIEARARPLLRRADYELVRTDGFDVWLPPRLSAGPCSTPCRTTSRTA